MRSEWTHSHRVTCALLLIVLSVASACSFAEEVDWPQFRGPTGQGHSTAKNLPLRWSETQNIAWSADVPGLGWSSPVLQGKRIWLTTATSQGKQLRVFCVDADDGSIQQNVLVFDDHKPVKLHPRNSHATPTPVIDGERVFVHYGPYGTACLTTAGDIVWKQTLPHKTYYGPSSSLISSGDNVIVHCDGLDERYVAALDKATGDIRWKMPREGRNAESTPLIINHDGVEQLISPAAEQIIAYNPQNGEPLWKCRHNCYAAAPRPVYAHGLVFVCTGYFDTKLLAIRPDGTGDVTDTHVAWSVTQGVPHMASPLVVDDRLYFVADNGILTCLALPSGKKLWKQRLQGTYSASPIAADGRIYFLNDQGLTTVLDAGKDYKVLAQNKLMGRTQASFAVTGNALFLRTDKRLLKITDQALLAKE